MSAHIESTGKSAMEVFFPLLWYKFIFMPRTKEIDRNMEICRIMETQEVIKKAQSREKRLKIINCKEVDCSISWNKFSICKVYRV